MSDVIDIKPLEVPEDIEKDMQSLSIKVGQLYHQKLCVEKELSDTTMSLNKRLLDYRTSLDKAVQESKA